MDLICVDELAVGVEYVSIHQHTSAYVSIGADLICVDELAVGVDGVELDEL